jgi:hypothetical protein
MRLPDEFWKIFDPPQKKEPVPEISIPEPADHHKADELVGLAETLLKEHVTALSAKKAVSPYLSHVEGTIRQALKNLPLQEFTSGDAAALYRRLATCAYRLHTHSVTQPTSQDSEHLALARHACETALALPELDVATRAATLYSLAELWLLHFQITKSLRSLDNGRQSLQERIDLRPAGDTHRAGAQQDLAQFLSLAADVAGDGRLQDEAIELHKLALADEAAADRAEVRARYARLWMRVFRRSGKPGALQVALGYWEEALELDSPARHYEHIAGYATTLALRVRGTDDLDNVIKGVVYFEDALPQLAQDDPYMAEYLAAEAELLALHAELAGSEESRIRSAERMHAALQLNPALRTADTDARFHSLTNDLVFRFQEAFDFGALESALVLLRAELALLPVTNAHYNDVVITLSHALSLRAMHKQDGSMEAREEALALLDAALARVPKSDEDTRGWLYMNHQCVLRNAYTRYTPDEAQAKIAAAHGYLALENLSANHVMVERALAEVGCSLRLAYEADHEAETLKEAVAVLERAADVDEPDDPLAQAWALINLGAVWLYESEVDVAAAGKLPDAARALIRGLKILPEQSADRPFGLLVLGLAGGRQTQLVLGDARGRAHARALFAEALKMLPAEHALAHRARGQLARWDEEEKMERREQKELAYVE